MNRSHGYSLPMVKFNMADWNRRHRAVNRDGCLSATCASLSVVHCAALWLVDRT